MAFLRAYFWMALIGLLVLLATVGIGIWYTYRDVLPANPSKFIFLTVLALDVGAVLMGLSTLMLALGVLAKQKRVGLITKWIVGSLSAAASIPMLVIMVRLFSSGGLALVLSRFYGSGIQIYRNPTAAMPWINRQMDQFHAGTWTMLAFGSFVYLLVWMFVCGVRGDSRTEGASQSGDDALRRSDDPQTAELSAIGSNAFLQGVGHDGGGVVNRRQ